MTPNRLMIVEPWDTQMVKDLPLSAQDLYSACPGCIVDS